MPTARLTLKMVLVLFAVGLLAGVVGIGLTWLLHAVQHLTFGVALDEHVSFRQIVEMTRPVHRLMALVACGLLVGVGWFLLHRHGSPLVSLSRTMRDDSARLPLKTTIAHALLQIVTVGMGSPLGREQAPRIFSAAVAEWGIRRLHFDAQDRRIILACAAGAGLAAVYNVPFASVVFTLETLLFTWESSAVGAALISCGTAVAVSRMGLGDTVQYTLPEFQVQPALMIWALLAGPALAMAVHVFDRHLALVPERSRQHWAVIPLALLSFTLIGVLSMGAPEILGNGKAGAQLVFASEIGWKYALALLLAKWLAVWLANAGGAYGGQITPSIMMGGMLALCLATLWNLDLTPIPLAGAGLVGAAVFLGLAQSMPLTSGVFLLELSRFSPAYLFPICLCFLTAIPALHWLQARPSGR